MNKTRSRGGNASQRKRFREGVKDVCEVERGVLITGLRKAVRETQIMVSDQHIAMGGVIESIASDADVPQPTGDKLNIDIEKEINSELESEQTKHQQITQRFPNVECAGLGTMSHLIQFKNEMDIPSKLIPPLMSRASEERELFRNRKEGGGFIPSRIKCRFTQRIVPLDIVIQPNQEKLTQVIQEVIRVIMPNSKVAKSTDEELDTQHKNVLLDEKKYKSDENTDVKDSNTNKEKDSNTNKEKDSNTSNEKDSNTSNEKDSNTSNEKDSNTSNEKSLASRKKIRSIVHSCGYRPLDKGESYALVYLRKSEYKGFTKKRVLEILDTAIGPVEDYTVNLVTPKISILVETNPSFFGVTVVENFHLYKNFNIQLLRHGSPEVQKNETKNASTEKKEASGTPETACIDTPV